MQAISNTLRSAQAHLKGHVPIFLSNLVALAATRALLGLVLADKTHMQNRLCENSPNDFNCYAIRLTNGTYESLISGIDRIGLLQCALGITVLQSASAKFFSKNLTPKNPLTLA